MRAQKYWNRMYIESIQRTPVNTIYFIQRKKRMVVSVYAWCVYDKRSKHSNTQYRVQYWMLLCMNMITSECAIIHSTNTICGAANFISSAIFFSSAFSESGAGSMKLNFMVDFIFMAFTKIYAGSEIASIIPAKAYYIGWQTRKGVITRKPRSQLDIRFVCMRDMFVYRWTLRNRW